MTRLLYLTDCYAKEFDAEVVDFGTDFVVLNQTLLYPTGGGQEFDIGELVFGDGEACKVVEVKKDQGIVKHIVDKQLANISQGMKVHGKVDWNRRYKNMRMHTSQHLIAAVVANLFSATCVGNQIYPDKSRIDFYPVDFSDEDLRKIEETANELISKNIEVTIEFASREEALSKINKTRVNLDKYPETLKEFRMINIHGVDYDPCGGTHIKNLKEIGRIKIVKKENKGQSKQRIEYVLE